MKGIVLAGGLGKRLYPLTLISNKHCLPVFKKPMIYYPLETLVNADITEILVVTGGNHAGDFLRLLGNGFQFGLKHISYTYQEGEFGIAYALSLAEDFASHEKIVVMLGDNIIEEDIKSQIEIFERENYGARLLLKEVEDPERFGVVEFDDNKRIVSIEEKPQHPKSNYIVTGILMFDYKVFDIIRTLKPSARNELEITDVNNAYLKANDLSYGFLKGFWTDAGTFDSLLKANNLIAEKERNKR